MKSPHKIPTRNPHRKSPHEIPTRNPHTKSPHEIPTRNPHTKSPHEIPTRNPHTKSLHEIPTRNPHTKSPHEIVGFDLMLFLFYRGICASDEAVASCIECLVKPLSKGYLKLYKSALTIREFFGLRDFYRCDIGTCLCL